MLAWGITGHAVVADIAESQLTPPPSVEVQRHLAVEGDKHLSDISAWADQAKREYLAGSPDHSIRLPLDGSPAALHACYDRFCAIDALTLYEGVLDDRSKSDTERQVALKYAVHLVGDLQQPLHAVDATGSGTRVRFDGRSTELHKVWDNGIIDDHGGSTAKIAHELAPLAGSVYAGGEPLDCAQEAREIAIGSELHEPPFAKGKETVVPHLKKVVLANAFSAFAETWSPRVGGDINDFQIKLVKFEGAFHWHHHESEDELFLVASGRLRMKLREADGGNVVLEKGEYIIIPHGIEHCPTAEPKCDVVLLERSSTLNTGNIENDRTVRTPARM